MPRDLAKDYNLGPETPAAAAIAAEPAKRDLAADYDSLAIADEAGELTPEVSVALDFGNKTPEELLAEHQRNLRAQNLEIVQDFAGRRHVVEIYPHDPRRLAERKAGAMDVLKGIMNTPAALASAMTTPASPGSPFNKIPAMLIDSVYNPESWAKLNIGNTTGKLLFGNDREQGQTLTAVGIGLTSELARQALPLAKAAIEAKPSVKQFRADRAQRALDVTKGRVEAAMGVHPNMPFDFASANDNALGWIKSWVKQKDSEGKLKGMFPELATGKSRITKWTRKPDLGQATEEWAKLTNDVAEEFYSRNYQSIAKPFGEVVVDSSPLAASLREFANSDHLRIHDPSTSKRLLNIADGYDGTQTLAQLEAHRKALNATLRGKYGQEIHQAAASLELNGVRELIDTKLDQLIQQNIPMKQTLKIYSDLARVRDIASMRVPQVRIESRAALGRHMGGEFVPTFVTETGVKAQIARTTLNKVTKGMNHPDQLLREVFRDLRTGPADFGGEPLPIVRLKYQNALPPAPGAGPEAFRAGGTIADPPLRSAPEILEPNILTTNNPGRNQPVQVPSALEGATSSARTRTPSPRGIEDSAGSASYPPGTDYSKLYTGRDVARTLGMSPKEAVKLGKARAIETSGGQIRYELIKP